MRPSIISLLATAAVVSAAEDGCLHNFDSLAITNSCGDDFSIAKCLAADVSLESLDQIEQCFIGGGCDAADSLISAVWFAHECNVNADEIEEKGRVDLKKRNAATATTASDESTASSEKTTAAVKTTSASETSDTSATETTTTDTSTTATTAPTTASTAPSTTSAATKVSSTTSITAASAATTGSNPNNCSTTKTTSTSVCSYWTTGKSNGATIGCTSTTTQIASCAAGNICTTDATGGNICMKRDDTLTTSGLIVTIVFVTGIGLFTIGLIIMGVKARQETAKQNAERTALLNKESQNYPRNGGAATSDTNLPLMTPGGNRNETYNKQETFGQTGAGNGNGSGSRSPIQRSPSGSNSVSPERGPVIGAPPKLHQGLGALGGGNDSGVFRAGRDLL